MQKINIRKLNSRTGRVVMLFLTLGALMVGMLAWPSPAQAHCDSVQGPVVQAADQALRTGDVNLVLPYIKADDEAELIAAFNQTRKVRALNPEAKELADTYFFETVVRLHRQGEGAAYTGLKDEKVPESIQLADQAMQSGNLAPVEKMLTRAMQDGLRAKYNAVLHAREQAKKAGTVEANRERVEAELMFEKYGYEMESALRGAAAHAEGPAAVEGHTH